MRHEIENRLPVTGDDNGLATLDLAGERGQTIFRIADGYGGHGLNLATCGQTVNGTKRVTHDRPFGL